MSDADMQTMVYGLFIQIIEGFAVAWGLIMIVNFFSDVNR